MSWEYRGVTFRTPASPYQRHCWQRLRRDYQALAEGHRTRVDGWLDDSAASALLKQPTLPGSVVAEPCNSGKPVDSRWN